MQIVSRDVIRLPSQFRVIFQIAALERSDTLDWSRSLHRLRAGGITSRDSAGRPPRPASVAPLVNGVIAASRATNE
jgi:hypothetical protein